MMEVTGFYNSIDKMSRCDFHIVCNCNTMTSLYPWVYDLSIDPALIHGRLATDHGLISP